MEQQPTKGRSKQVLISAGVIVVIALMIAGVIAVNQSSQQTAGTTEPTTSTTPNSTDSIATTGTTATTYKAGTYEAQGTYTSPGGTTAIDVSLTIDAAGRITDTTATSATDNPTSRQYQAKFIGGFKEQVVGKNVNEVKLSKVSGSSLTPKGFNDALEQIRQQANA